MKNKLFILTLLFPFSSLAETVVEKQARILTRLAPFLEAGVPCPPLENQLVELTLSQELELARLMEKGKVKYVIEHMKQDRGSALVVSFDGPHSGVVVVAAKGYKVGQYSRQWENKDDSKVWKPVNELKGPGYRITIEKN